MNPWIKFWSITIGATAIGMFFALNAFSYFDPLRMCYIRIESDIVRGDRSAIKDALELLKNRSSREYSLVCDYVSTISERSCKPGDPRVDSKFKNISPSSCYIRGTKIMYMDPSKDTSPEAVERRAEAIARSALMSLEFWRGK